MDQSSDAATHAVILGTEDTAADVQGFMDWLAHYSVGNCITVGYFPDLGRGAMATRDINPGETVVSIPYNLLITEAAALRHPVLGPLLFPLRKKLLCEQVMCLHILVEKFDDQSLWKWYFRLLPKSFTTTDYLQDAELELLGDFRKAKALRRRVKIRGFYDGLRSDVLTKHPELFPESRYTWDEFLWAYNILDSRAFCITDPCRAEAIQALEGTAKPDEDSEEEDEEEEGDEDEEEESEDEAPAEKTQGGSDEPGKASAIVTKETSTEDDQDDWAIVPLADMFNHSVDGETEFSFDTELRVFTCVVGRAYQCGEQICIKYNSMGNWHLLKHYGFVVEVVPYVKRSGRTTHTTPIQSPCHPRTPLVSFVTEYFKLPSSDSSKSTTY
eukprot:TRINITY_DN15652_c0_g1_i3.p1 TRINITY_DN15652_c0_g1~~TRINITY_DN15652_c0_g1_i3.p1  ORF type:complete len:393 (+),score=64.63 TRINITY_DN15652_c0_g1_i3:26-1180(+)